MPIGPVSAPQWSAATLRRVLLSPRVAGLRQDQGEVLGKAVWEPILDRETWELTKAILSDPARLKWKPAARYLLTGGKIVDSLGRVMIARPSSGRRRCYVSLPDEKGRGMRIGASEVDEMVLEMVRSVATSNLEQLPRDVPGDDIEALEAELDELRQLRATNQITMKDWLVLRAPLEARLTNARPSTRVDAAGLLRRYDSLTIAELRAVVGELVESVVIMPAVRGRNTFDPHRVMINLKFGGIAVP